MWEGTTLAGLQGYGWTGVRATGAYASGVTNFSSKELAFEDAEAMREVDARVRLLAFLDAGPASCETSLDRNGRDIRIILRVCLVLYGLYSFFFERVVRAVRTSSSSRHRQSTVLCRDGLCL